MKNTYKFLLLFLVCIPTFAFGDVNDITKATTIAEADNAYIDSIEELNADEASKKKAEQHVKDILSSVVSKTDKRTTKEKEKDLKDKQDAYNAAKEKENSTANKTLTALTSAATGIGGMELARGLSEQKSDKEAEQDMAAYLETFRCTYGNDKQVKAGPDTIELPGGNDETMMKLRAEYFALAADLKTRKTALNLKPGIESEEIMDKSKMGLYDSENIGITNGAYASLYRSMALNSETDQAKIDEDKKASKNRVIAGAVVGGVGVIGGIVGNSLINGKLGEKIREAKEKKNSDKNEKEALERLQKCLKDGGAKNTNKLKFDYFTPSILHLEKIHCKGSDWTGYVEDEDATELFADTTDEETITETLIDSFDTDIAGKLLDEDLSDYYTTVSDNSGSSVSPESTSTSTTTTTTEIPSKTPTPNSSVDSNNGSPTTSQSSSAATPTDASAADTAGATGATVAAAAGTAAASTAAASKPTSETKTAKAKTEQKKSADTREKAPAKKDKSKEVKKEAEQKSTETKKETAKTDTTPQQVQKTTETKKETAKTKQQPESIDFSFAKVTEAQGKQLAQLWGSKKGVKLTYKEKTTKMFDDILVFSDGTKDYNFTFDDLYHNSEKDQKKSIAEILCKQMYKANISFATYDGNPKCDLKENKCTELNNDLNKFNLASEMHTPKKAGQIQTFKPTSNPLQFTPYCRIKL